MDQRKGRQQRVMSGRRKDKRFADMRAAMQVVAVAMMGAGLLSGCAAGGQHSGIETSAAQDSGAARQQAIEQRDRRLRILDAQRQAAQRACDKGDKSQCQRVEILGHEMDGYLVRPW